MQVEHELQALPKLHVKCLSITIAFSFGSNIQIPQYISVSTVKFRDEQLMYFTSSTLWLSILRHLLEMLLEFHSG